MNEPKYKNEQKPRITIYCNDEEQKEYISSKMDILRNKTGKKTNSDLLKYLLFLSIESMESTK